MSPRPDRVGVVVLNYRGVDDTIACLESLAALDVAAHVIVVDNGSGDGSAQRLATVPGVELIVNDTNLGFAAGNNVAIERLLEAGVDYVWVLNNDTRWRRRRCASCSRSPRPNLASAPSAR